MKDVGRHKGVEMDRNYFYWTSTEYSSYYAHAFCAYYGGSDDYNSKINSYRLTRAILDLN